jgi:hypothetical protein
MTTHSIVSPAMHGSGGLLSRKNSARSGPREPLFLSIQYHRCIIHMHHSRFTRRRQRVRHTSTFPHQAPDVFWPRLKFPSGSAEGTSKKKSWRRNDLVNNCLLVLTLVLTIIPFGSQHCLLRPISIRIYTRANPVFPKVLSSSPI